MPYATLFRSLALTAGTLTVLAACASSGTAGAEAGASASASASATAPRRDRTVITQEELAGSGTTNLLDAVQRLRPQWLRGVNLTSRTGGDTEFVVYQGTTFLGGVDALRQLAPGYAQELRYLDASQATNTLPGLGSRRVAGAIVIVLPGGRR